MKPMKRYREVSRSSFLKSIESEILKNRCVFDLPIKDHLIFMRIQRIKCIPIVADAGGKMVECNMPNENTIFVPGSFFVMKNMNTGFYKIIQFFVKMQNLYQSDNSTYKYVIIKTITGVSNHQAYIPFP
jgi:hypothetical protein